GRQHASDSESDPVQAAASLCRGRWCALVRAVRPGRGNDAVSTFCNVGQSGEREPGGPRELLHGVAAAGAGAGTGAGGGFRSAAVHHVTRDGEGGGADARFEPDGALLLRLSAQKLWSEGRANPVWYRCSSWVGVWTTDDRITWRTTDGTWLAQIERSAN